METCTLTLKSRVHRIKMSIYPISPNKISTFFFWLFRATCMKYVSSQSKGQIGATGASLHHSHSNSGSKLRLGPILQLTATLDP